MILNTSPYRASNASFRGSNPVRFGNGLAIDVGASQGGSSKFQETDVSGNPIGERRNYPIRPFVDSNDFVRALAENIQRFNQEIHSQVPLKKKYDVIVAHLPGIMTQPGIMAAFSNLKTTAGNAIKNVNFNPLKTMIGNPDARLITISDVAGGLTEILHQLNLKHPDRLKTGEKITLAVTGGGLGMSNGHIWEKDIRISCSEAGTVKDHTRMGLPLEQTRTSVTALKNNYLDVLHRDITTINLFKNIQINNGSLPGQIVTKYDIAKKYIPTLTVFSHRRASNKAIDDYVEGLAMAFH